MAQYFMDLDGVATGGLKNMGKRVKVFDNLTDARKFAIKFLMTKNRMAEKGFENYEKYGGTMPYPVYGVAINTIKNGIYSRCGYVKKETTSTGKVKFTWRGITINPNGTLRKISKKKVSPFGL